jgi:hypothetical protein
MLMTVMHIPYHAYVILIEALTYPVYTMHHRGAWSGHHGFDMDKSHDCLITKWVLNTQWNAEWD